MAATNFSTLLSRLANASLPKDDIGYEGYDSTLLLDALWPKRKARTGSTVDLIFNKGRAANAEWMAALGTGDGFTVDTTINPRQSRRLQFDWRELAVPVLINNVEAKKVGGGEALVNYMAEQVREPVEDLRQLLAFTMITGGDTSQEIGGLDHICSYANQSTTYGGIDRDSAAALNGNVWDASDVEGTTYSTGTVDVLTRASNVITGDSTVWTAADHAGKDIVITGADGLDRTYQIVSRDSNTVVNINKPYEGASEASAAAAAYVIQSRFNDVDLYGGAGEFDLEKVDAVWASCLQGGDSPDMVALNHRMFQKFVSEVGYTEQSETKDAMNRLGITKNYTGFMYHGMIVCPDDHVESTNIYFINTKHLELAHVPGYGDIKLAGGQLNRVTDGTYHDASVGSLVLSLVLATRACNRFGKLTGLNS